MLLRFISAAVLCSAAGAQVTTFTFEQGVDNYQGFADTTLSESTPDNAGGGSSSIFAGTTGPLNSNGILRALIRADLSAIPAGATVVSAELELTVTRFPLGADTMVDYALHRLTADWGEGDAVGQGDGAPADPGDATWNEAFHEMTDWTTDGGDFISMASATATAGTSGSTVTWTSQQLAADVQAWLDGSADNFGWLIKAVDEGGTSNARTARGFASAEDGQNPPRLIIEAEVPELMVDADINDDNVTDAVDVQLVINAALGLSIGGLDADINGDGTEDAVDVQLVINAVLLG